MIAKGMGRVPAGRVSGQGRGGLNNEILLVTDGACARLSGIVLIIPIRWSESNIVVNLPRHEGKDAEEEIVAEA